MALRVEILGIGKIHTTAKALKDARQKIHDQLHQEALNFGNRAIATIREEYLSGPRPKRLGRVSGELTRRTRFRADQNGPQTTIVFGNDLPYARRWEFGDKTPVSIPVTPKMRKYFWFQYFKTGDPKWKRMALMKKGVIKQKFEARPFLRPGIEDELPGFQNRVNLMLEKIAAGVMSGQQ